MATTMHYLTISWVTPAPNATLLCVTLALAIDTKISSVYIPEPSDGRR